MRWFPIYSSYYSTFSVVGVDADVVIVYRVLLSSRGGLSRVATFLFVWGGFICASPLRCLVLLVSYSEADLSKDFFRDWGITYLVFAWGAYAF